MMTRLCISLSLALLLSVPFLTSEAKAAACPPASINTVCADFTEGTVAGGSVVSTVVTLTRDGVALTPITVPASSAAGGQVMSTSVPTVECQSDTYTAQAFTNYTIGGVAFKSLTVASVGSVIKNRTTEAACTVQPGNFTIR